VWIIQEKGHNTHKNGGKKRTHKRELNSYNISLLYERTESGRKHYNASVNTRMIRC
jgi:hypothetical protein